MIALLPCPVANPSIPASALSRKVLPICFTRRSFRGITDQNTDNRAFRRFIPDRYDSPTKQSIGHAEHVPRKPRRVGSCLSLDRRAFRLPSPALSLTHGSVPSSPFPPVRLSSKDREKWACFANFAGSGDGILRSPDCMAERVGFEPTLPFRVNTLSKRAPSATRPSLRRNSGRTTAPRNILQAISDEAGSESCRPSLAFILWAAWRKRKWPCSKKSD